MFGSLLLIINTLMHIYVFWRTSSVPFVKRHIPRKILFLTGFLLWAVFLFARVMGHGGTGTFASILELFGLNWMAMLFLAFVCLLTIDLFTGFGFLFPRISPTLRGCALVAGGILSMIALIQGLRPPIVQNYEVQLSGLPHEMDGKALVAMSDLHLGSQLGKQWMEARVAQVQALRPDIIVLLGDLFEGHGEPQTELISILSRLSAPLGIWAVPGNHESHGGLEKSMSLIKDASVQVLRNRWAEVKPGFILAGVDDLTAERRSGNGNDLIMQALTGRPAGATILLSHTPWQAERAAGAGVGLMLSGHTHGGQVWPFGYITQLYYPLLEGRYEVGGMTVIVCRGTGSWGPRMRLWHRSEILCITLRAKDRNG